MTPEAQRIAIAEACGWQKMQRPLSDADGEIPGYFETVWFHPKIHTSVYPMYILPKNPPDYLNDLNAMAEAEMMLTDFQRRKHGLMLQEIIHEAVVGFVPDYERQLAGLSRIVSATAAQRAEAFLRTLNLWRDET